MRAATPPTIRRRIDAMLSSPSPSRRSAVPALPPGQRELTHFPRFGLSQFAHRFPSSPSSTCLQICGEVERPIELTDPLDGLPRVEQISDFHCVTTWSRRGLRWSGVRFSDFHAAVILPQSKPAAAAEYLYLRGQDGARTCVLLEDLLEADVLLADRLDGEPLALAHGAPLRLVAPSQYGYKSVKHLCRIEFRLDQNGFRPAAFAFMDHLRARVALEERGRGVPGWLLRYLYRPLIGPTVRRFAAAMGKHETRSATDCSS